MPELQVFAWTKGTMVISARTAGQQYYLLSQTDDTAKFRFGLSSRIRNVCGPTVLSCELLDKTTLDIIVKPLFRQQVRPK
jgi:hypothetical protein